MANRSYRARRKVSLADQDRELLAAARMFGHHGPANFVEVARQRHNMAITLEYASDLISRAGCKR